MPENFGDKHIALVGMMAAGKSTIARRLAKELGRPCSDSDHLIEIETGKSAPEVLRDDEQTFRALEESVICRALSAQVAGVLAVAGGALMRNKTRDELAKHAIVIWLNVPIEVLIERIKSAKQDRPMLRDNPEHFMRALYEERRPLYESCADYTIEAGHRFPKQLVSEIVALVQEDGQS